MSKLADRISPEHVVPMCAVCGTHLFRHVCNIVEHLRTDTHTRRLARTRTARVHACELWCSTHAELAPEHHPWCAGPRASDTYACVLPAMACRWYIYLNYMVQLRCVPLPALLSIYTKQHEKKAQRSIERSPNRSRLARACEERIYFPLRRSTWRMRARC